MPTMQFGSGSGFQGRFCKKQLRYWMERLKGAPPQLELPTDRRGRPWKDSKGATLSFNLPASLSSRLKELGRREGATLFMAILQLISCSYSRWSWTARLVVDHRLQAQKQEVESLSVFLSHTWCRTDLTNIHSAADKLPGLPLNSVAPSRRPSSFNGSDKEAGKLKLSVAPLNLSTAGRGRSVGNSSCGGAPLSRSIQVTQLLLQNLP